MILRQRSGIGEPCELISVWLLWAKSMILPRGIETRGAYYDIDLKFLALAINETIRYNLLNRPIRENMNVVAV